MRGGDYDLLAMPRRPFSRPIQLPFPGDFATSNAVDLLDVVFGVLADIFIMRELTHHFVVDVLDALIAVIADRRDRIGEIH